MQELLVRPYRLLYKVTPTEIQIIALLHQRRSSTDGVVAERERRGSPSNTRLKLKSAVGGVDMSALVDLGNADIRALNGSAPPV